MRDRVLVISLASFAGAASFGATTLTSAGGDDAFVLALDSSGNPLWVKRFGGAVTDGATAIAANPNGTMAFSGFFGGSVDFGSGPITAAGSDGFVVALTGATGAPLWSRTFGGPGDDRGNAIAIDPAGDVVAAGYASSALDLGSGPLPFAGATDAFVAKWGFTGTLSWAREMGTPFADQATSIAVSTTGDVAIAGWVLFPDGDGGVGAIDLGTGPLGGVSDYDAFIARLAP